MFALLGRALDICQRPGESGFGIGLEDRSHREVVETVQSGPPLLRGSNGPAAQVEERPA
jgi:hypothetical protein